VSSYRPTRNSQLRPALAQGVWCQPGHSRLIQPTIVAAARWLHGAASTNSINQPIAPSE
jgi:hypothetical protein